MVNKKISFEILAIILILGMTVAGCDDGSMDNTTQILQSDFYGQWF